MTMVKRRIAYVSLLLAVLTFAAVFLFGCHQEYRGDTVYGAYISRIDYDDENMTMTAVVSLTNDGAKMMKLNDTETVQVDWNYQKSKVGAFKFRYDYRASFNPNRIFCAVENTLTQEQRKNKNGDEYSLKVVFEYATIYKSLKGDVTPKKSGNYYLLDFDVLKDETSFETKFSIETQNSAAWYGTLIAVACACFIVIMFVKARRKNNGERKDRTTETD